MAKLLRMRLAQMLTMLLIALLVQSLPAVHLPDFDESGAVDFTDFLLFVSAFGSKKGEKTYEARYDLNGDGIIGFNDFLVFANSFGKSQDESRFGVSTLAKIGESIGVILFKGNLATGHHYVLDHTQENFQQKAATFAIDEKTGEVRLKVEPARWEKENYFLEVALLSQQRERIAITKVSIYKKHRVMISPSSDLNAVLQKVSGPATIAFADGIYTDLGRVAFSKSGDSRYDTVEMRAINPGAVTITGNTAFDISGNYNVFHGFIFRDIRSNIKIGRSQFPTPLTIRGDHNRITECVFYPRAQADKHIVLLSNSLRANGKVARFTRIDHCAFLNKAYLQFDNTHFQRGNEFVQGTNNPISARVDHNFFQNIEDSFFRLGRIGNRDSESIFDANLIAGNRTGDEEHFVGKMGGFLWLNNTVEDCNKYLSLRMGGYAYIVHSYFLQRSAMAIIGWDRNHIIVGNYFRVNGRNTPDGQRPYTAIFRMGEGATGPQGGHSATTDWVIAYNTFDAPADVPFVNFMGKYSRRAYLAQQLNAAQQRVQQGTYIHTTPPEERYRFTHPINNVFIGNLFYHREAATSKPQTNFSFIHYGVWEQNTFISNLISSPVTEIYEHDTSDGKEENARQITQNLKGLTFISRGAVSRDHNGLLITPVEIPPGFRVPNYEMLPIDLEVYSKVVDEKKKRAYPIVSQKPKIPPGGRKDTLVKEYTPFEVESIVQDTLAESLEEVLRNGARKMLCAALEYEVNEYIARFAAQVDEKGHREVVKNGYHPAREVTTGIGKIPIKQPRVHDRREGHHFTSAILPKYARRSPSIDTLIPTLYLKGVSTSAFPQALEAILGKGASGLSPANITRLKRIWEDEYKQWQKRDLHDKHYVYLWADGIYFNVRLSDDRPCVLVLIGATAEGKKEVLAIEQGQRESTLSWQSLLQDVKARGLSQAPALAIGDGATGFWHALEEAFPATKHQRCWVHKTANVLDKLPKSVQADAKGLLHDMYQSPTKEAAHKVYARFLSLYQDRYEKACDCLTKDFEVLFTFYDFPAKHWLHLRTTNPIESTFATVRHRTRQTKGCGSVKATMAMVYKLAIEAEKTWVRLRGYRLIPLVIDGVIFVDGERKIAA